MTEEIREELRAAYNVLSVDPEEARLLAKAHSQGKPVKKWLRSMVDGKDMEAYPDA